MLQGTPLAPKSYSGRMWASLESQGISDRSMQMLLHQRRVFRCLTAMQTQACGHPQVCVSSSMSRIPLQNPNSLYIL